MTDHATHLAARLDGAASLWERPLSLSSIPYGYVRVEAEDGLWRLGDQSAVIPSFAGDGHVNRTAQRESGRRFVSGRTESSAVSEPADCRRAWPGRPLYAVLSRSFVNPRIRYTIAALAHLWSEMLAYVAGITRIRAASLGL